MTQDERPVHVDIHVPTGAVTHTPITDEEWDAMRAATEQAWAAERREFDKTAELRAAVAAHPDPVVQALAARAGLA